MISKYLKRKKINIFFVEKQAERLQIKIIQNKKNLINWMHTMSVMEFNLQNKKRHGRKHKILRHNTASKLIY